MQGARLFLRFARFDHGTMKKRRPGMQAPLPRIRSTVSTIPHTHRRRKNRTRQVSRSPEDRPGRGAPMSPPKTNLPTARRQETIISPCRPRRQCRWAREEDGTRTKNKENEQCSGNCDVECPIGIPTPTSCQRTSSPEEMAAGNDQSGRSISECRPGSESEHRRKEHQRRKRNQPHHEVEEPS